MIEITFKDIEPKELCDLIKTAMEDKKASDIMIIDMKKRTIICDFFMICSTETPISAKAISDNIEIDIKKGTGRKPRIAGYLDGNWILMDYGDIIVHIFTEETRGFYDLEGLWEKARKLED